MRGSETKARPGREFGRLAALAHKGFVDEAFGHDHMRERVEHGDVGAGLQRQMIVRFDMRRTHEIDAARIDDDELRALAQPFLHMRGEDRMAVGRIGADDDDHVGIVRPKSNSCVPAEVPNVVFSP